MKMFLDGVPFRKANFHAHTTCSDGAVSPAECAALYRAKGYDFLAITDHRSVTVLPKEECPEGLVLVNGVEFDYDLPGQAAHIIGIGVKPDTASRWQRADGPQAGVDLIRRDGGRAILAHPAWSLNTPEFICSLTGLTAAEIWNSVSMPPLNGIRGDSSAVLDLVSTGGTNLRCCANDDSHPYKAEFARGWNMIQTADKTAEGILAAMDAGRFYATQGPEITQIEAEDGILTVTHSPAAQVIFYSNLVWSGDRCQDGSAGVTRYKFRPDETFVRVQILDRDGNSAWSSPVSTQE